MPELPQKKIGIVACSGEEMPEGTVTRLAALKVLEQLRPQDTVTICLPLFLAGGEGDRAFAKFYPTITIDGCDKRCAYRGTAEYSNEPARSIVITDLITQQGLEKPQGKRKLNDAGLHLVDLAAGQVSAQVDELLGKTWNRREGKFAQAGGQVEEQDAVTATCSCGSGIPIQKLMVNGQEMTVLALPLIYQNFYEAKKIPSEPVLAEMMETVKIYNRIEPAGEAALRQEIYREYQAYWDTHEVNHG